jgi:predicted DCC family thiol-disulfide oxidoreductase YuxK
MADPHLILFDGACGLCRRAAAWAGARDRRGLFRAVPYWEAPAPPMTPELFSACARAVHVVRSDGRILRGGRAVLFVLEHTGMGGWARVLGLPPMVWGVELGYWIVAHNRRLFGRFF